MNLRTASPTAFRQGTAHPPLHNVQPMAEWLARKAPPSLLQRFFRRVTR